MAGATRARIRIDLESGVPAYRQIADEIRALMVTSALGPGEMLPTVRELGLDLGIHHNTVADAYRLLAEEGWLELVRGRGAIVIDRAKCKATIAERERFRARLRHEVAQALSQGVPVDVVGRLLREAMEALGPVARHSSSSS
jgi:GntR family transcriptional regulator